MQDGTEGQAIPPRCAEVGDLYSLVPVGDVLTPLEQRLAGVHQVLQQEERGRGGKDEEKEGQLWLCVFVCLCMLCMFTSTESSFPSASSLTTGTGSGDLRSEVSSSGNVGSRDAFISQ